MGRVGHFGVRAVALAACIGLCVSLATSIGCDGPEESAEAPAPTASVIAVTAPREVDETVVPPRRLATPNPLGLPPTSSKLAEGTFVYAVPEKMLSSSKLGASLELRAAKVEAMDGNDVLVRMGNGPAYAVHPGYVVVPRPGKVARGTRVLVPYRERLRHGVVERQSHERIVVRYGDVDAARGEHGILAEEVGILSGGLEPGSSALVKDERGQALVLLISATRDAEGVERWLALGEEGTSRLVATSELSPVPDVRKLKPGSSVRVAWHGRMVPATLRAVEPNGLVSVKRPRVGPVLLVGPDFVMPDSAPTSR
jgi:hypothetical protein